MVDILRAYRRWLLRRLAFLVPAFAVALLANLWIALGTQIERWLKVISLVLSGLSLATLGYLLSETLMCAALQRRGNRALARPLREQLSLSGRVAGACLLVLLVIIGAPFAVTRPDPARPPTSRARRPVIEEQFPPVEFTQVVPPALAVAEPAADPPRPQIRPVVADVPSRLEVEEKELDAPVALAPFLQEEAPPKKAVEDQDGPEALRFKPEPFPAGVPDPDAPGTTAVDRPGLPGEEGVGLPAPAFRMEVLFLTMEENRRGGGFKLETDQPLSRSGSVVAEYMAVVIGRGDDVNEYRAEMAWHRLTLGYLHRLVGYTRHARFDLAVTAGLSADRFQSDDDIDSKARISPYAAVDVGLWQGGNWGLTAHASHSLPWSLTGASIGVTEISAAFRLDLSEKVSFFAGYRMLFVKLKEHEGALEREHGREEFEDTLAGPLIGLEYRF